MKKKPLLWLMIITCIVLLFQVKNFMFVKYKVEGVSMDPTFYRWNRIINQQVLAKTHEN